MIFVFSACRCYNCLFLPTFYFKMTGEETSVINLSWKVTEIEPDSFCCHYCAFTFFLMLAQVKKQYYKYTLKKHTYRLQLGIRLPVWERNRLYARYCHSHFSHDLLSLKVIAFSTSTIGVNKTADSYYVTKLKVKTGQELSKLLTLGKHFIGE